MIPDTDYDGMPDGWEVNYQLNPVMDDAVADVAPTRSSRGWQFLSLAQPTPARYVKLLALGNTANNGFHLVEWEVYGNGAGCSEAVEAASFPM